MIVSLIITIVGLCLFEVISSFDNAVVNAHVLGTLPPKYRRIFLSWGLLFAVFIVRGLLPFLIVWLANQDLSFGQLISATVSGSGDMSAYLAHSRPLLLLGGGVYLFFVFLSWLFLEEKSYAFLAEGFLHRQGAWFYALASVLTTAIVYFSLHRDPVLALAATVGVSAFFIADGFKKNAEGKEKELRHQVMAAWSKIIYLEILDASFSIDGVIGAFAFTLSVLLIILGNGLGALVVRELTVKGIDIITRFAYLKNGAMYAIGVLGALMILESFGQVFPFWLAPSLMIILLGFFLFLSTRAKSRDKAAIAAS